MVLYYKYIHLEMLNLKLGTRCILGDYNQYFYHNANKY